MLGFRGGGVPGGEDGKDQDERDEGEVEVEVEKGGAGERDDLAHPEQKSQM